MRRRAAFVLLVLVGSLPAKAQNQASTSQQESQAVEFCNLVRHPEQYDGKAVKVTATYFTDLEGSIFFDDACPKSQPYEEVTANAKFAKGKDGTAAYEKLRRFLVKYRVHVAKVTTVATFSYPSLSGRLEECAGCSYTLEVIQILALERIGPPGAKKPNN